MKPSAVPGSVYGAPAPVEAKLPFGAGCTGGGPKVGGELKVGTLFGVGSSGEVAVGPERPPPSATATLLGGPVGGSPDFPHLLAVVGTASGMKTGNTV